VSYRETIQKSSEKPSLAKSPNKLNRIFISSSPMEPSLLQSIDKGEISAHDEPQKRARELTQQHGWEADTAKKIWCFGPDTQGANLLIDGTKAVPYLHTVKDTATAAFQWATKEGPLCEEPLRGCCFKIVDVLLHSDTVHRNAAQLVPSVRRAVHGSFLSSSPSLQEPFYLAEIQCPEASMGGVHQILNRRRGQLVSQEHAEGTPLVIIKAFLPVRESFGFGTALRAATGGQAFPQLVFDHWETMSPELLNASGVVTQIRIRKGLSPDPFPVEHYVDRL